MQEGENLVSCGKEGVHPRGQGQTYLGGLPASSLLCMFCDRTCPLATAYEPGLIKPQHDENITTVSPSQESGVGTQTSTGLRKAHEFRAGTCVPGKAQKPVLKRG